MKQHAIPQDVKSYQFRLIGDMTVKQFVELAAGVLLAWGTISSKLPSIFKWPLAACLAFFGFALAFMPFEERPLEVWLKNFMVSIFRPTIFVWHKKPAPKQKSAPSASVLPKPNLKKSPERPQQKLDAYLKTIQPKKLAPLPIDQLEQKKLKSIEGLLFGLNKLTKPGADANGPAGLPSIPSLSPNMASIKGVRVRKLRPVKDVQKQKILYQKPPAPKKALPPKPAVPTPKITVNPKPMVLPPSDDENTNQFPVVQAPPLAPPLKVKSLFPEKKGTRASFMQNMQMPVDPDQPNVLTGMVTTPSQKILAGAVLEIKNNRGETVRALKTNRLGQFFMATPLENNHYQIFVEHPDWDFDIINLELEGKVLKPLKIIAKRKAPV